ncbi:hypothetical protein PWY87_12965 [Kribbella solani]|uniref:hypothetical protein n=1 Tax=Kribbella solani TaxID=236067 RepID=UPI0029BD8358|nr:hypothetical protein [Kribbella solani]MDX2972890.1 hypothetical protein [Kribbella solani]MDX3002590.1 hypothetical protein [Kribbella solani]
MSVDIPLQAFGALLHSANIPTVCRALNMYQVAAAYTQLSGGNPLEPMADDVRQVAREIISRPPVEASDDIQAGFDHLSALNVLTMLAEPADADLIAAVLDSTQDEQIRAVASLAANTALAADTARRKVTGGEG